MAPFWASMLIFGDVDLIWILFFGASERTLFPDHDVQRVRLYASDLADWTTGRLKVTKYLEDHPMTCKWLITMVSKSPNWGCGTP